MYIREYNSAMEFVSIDGDIELPTGNRPYYCYKIRRQNVPLSFTSATK